MNIRFILILTLALLLSACGTTKTEVKTDFTYHPIPEALLIECDAVPPPNRDVYLSQDNDGKEKMWVETYKRQDASRKVCNGQIKQLFDWNKKQADLYEKSKEAK